MNLTTKNLRFTVSEKSGEVSGILLLPEEPSYLLLFAHGAGAPMTHIFMETMASYLAKEHIGTLRFNFPYMEINSKRPDHASVLMQTIQSAARVAKEYAIDIPLLAGGKSMGGRMTSMAASKELLTDIKGIVFFGFPLHAPGQPSDERSAHLFQVKVPFLFLQGTKDKLADLFLLKPIIEKLGDRALLYTVDGADHSFHLPKSAGIKEEDVLTGLARMVRTWADDIKDIEQ